MQTRIEIAVSLEALVGCCQFSVCTSRVWPRTCGTKLTTVANICRAPPGLGRAICARRRWTLQILNVVIGPQDVEREAEQSTTLAAGNLCRPAYQNAQCGRPQAHNSAFHKRIFFFFFFFFFKMVASFRWGKTLILHDTPKKPLLKDTWWARFGSRVQRAGLTPL